MKIACLKPTFSMHRFESHQDFTADQICVYGYMGTVRRQPLRLLQHGLRHFTGNAHILEICVV